MNVSSQNSERVKYVARCLIKFYYTRAEINNLRLLDGARATEI